MGASVFCFFAGKIGSPKTHISQKQTNVSGEKQKQLIGNGLAAVHGTREPNSTVYLHKPAGRCMLHRYEAI